MLLKKGKSTNLPGCFDVGVKVNSQVYVLGYEADSAYVHVAYFYESSYGKKLNFIGYALRETLHDQPYIDKSHSGLRKRPVLFLSSEECIHARALLTKPAKILSPPANISKTACTFLMYF
jgi:hypothetical protein